MNRILIVLSILVVACSNNASQVQGTKGDEHEQHDSAVDAVKVKALQLNNNARWKTDGDTRRNVTAMVEVMNDTTNIGNNRSEQLIAQMQDRIDTLVQQCKMKGPDHDALHLWLQQVKHDLKRIQEEGGEGYEQFYAALKRDVKSFYVYFE
jgi:hypothetical protein